MQNPETDTRPSAPRSRMAGSASLLPSIRPSASLLVAQAEKSTRWSSSSRTGLQIEYASPTSLSQDTSSKVNARLAANFDPLSRVPFKNSQPATTATVPVTKGPMSISSSSMANMDNSQGYTSTRTTTINLSRSTSTFTTTKKQLPASYSPIPRYSGTGNLLVNYCAYADFTLVDGGPTMYYAPFVGCINDKQGCCPFTPMTTIHARAQITDPASLQGRSVYPQAQNARDGILEHCADDYYSISGSCCPSGYAPWTTLLGDETPCVSSLRSTITPPPVPTTSGTNTAATSKPTLVISDVVYAMQYPLKEESTPALSTGAIAGIAVGIAVTVLATAGLAIFFLKRRRSAHQAADLKRSLRSSFTGLKGAPSEARTSTIATQVSEVSIVQALQHIPRTSASLERGNAALNVFRDPPALPPPVHSKDEHVPGQRPVSHRKNDDDYGYDYDHDHDDLDDTTEGFHLYSEISSSPGCGGDFGGDATVLEAQEVQLARPQRLSRGYARIVYTHSHGSSLGSSASVPADLDLSAVEEGEQRRDDKDDHNNDDVNGTGNGSEGRNLVDK